MQIFSNVSPPNRIRKHGFERLFLLFFVGFCHFLTAQTISSSAVSADGGRISTPEIILDWTLGEAIVGDVSTNNIRLTEGFQQPILKVEIVIDAAVFASERTNLATNTEGGSMECWPNPVGEKLNARVISADWPTATIQLLNIEGQLLQKSEQSTNVEFEISMNGHQNGQYFLQFLNPKGQLIGTRKITVAR